MKCDKCTVKDCETREMLKKYTDPMLIKIIEENCKEFEGE